MHWTFSRMWHSYLFVFFVPRAVAVALDSTASHRSFADSLTVRPGGLWADGEPNVCSSSLGISMAFDIVYPGSSGTSQTQLRDTFGYPAVGEQLVWAGLASRLAARYTGAVEASGSGKSPIVRIANSVWIDSSTSLLSAYAQVVGNLLHQIDFVDGGRYVNEWCAEATAGLIPNVLPPGPIDAAMLAINAIYLNASWENDFNARYTNEDAFYTDPSRRTATSKPCHFMHQVSRFSHSASALPGFEVIQLPYASSTLSMIIALPGKAGGTATWAGVLGALPKLESKRVALALPKFKFRSSFERTIKSTLQAMGLTAPWQGGFPSIVEGKELAVEKVLQKTFLYVWEKGTEAAAVTVVKTIPVSVGPPPEPPVIFLADHPFQFWIYDSQEDIVLFEGRVGAPEAIEDAVAQVSRKHDDADFWTSQFGKSAEPQPPTSRAAAPWCLKSLLLVVSLLALT